MEVADVPPTEKRRAPRFAAELLVRLEGINEDYHPARGNISTTGLLLELPSAPGSPGDLELLHLASLDLEYQLEIFGQIVRCVTIETLGDSHPKVAVVFEFLPDRSEGIEPLQQLIEHVVRQQEEEFVVDHRFPAEMLTDTENQVDTPPKAATVFRLHVERMQLETTWPVNLGDRVQLTFRTSDTRLPFEGLVSRVEPTATSKTPLYEVDVDLRKLGEKVKSPNNKPPIDTIDLVLSEMMTREGVFSEQAQRHLSGRLDRIPLTSLLTFLEMERQTGRIAVEDGDGTTLFLETGRIVDVDPATEDPVAQLATVLTNRSGRFEFTCEPIERPDRIGRSTTHLLLELARQEDERDGRD